MSDQTPAPVPPQNNDVKTVHTPIGKKRVDLKTYITGRDEEFIDEAYMEAANVKANMGNQQPNADGSKISKEQLEARALENTEFTVNANAAKEARHRQIQAVVVSVDGSTEDVLNKVLDMRKEDYQFVLNEVDKVINPEVYAKKA